LGVKVVAVVGSKKSGKTTVIEALIRELSKRGYKIAAVKHIPEENFTIDTAGKDTWRFKMSGANMVISIAPNEMTVIENIDTSTLSLEQILEKCKGIDLVLMEGFRNILQKNEKIPKIVSVKSAEEALEALKTFNPIIAFTGPYKPESLNLNIPYVDVLKNEKLIADMVEDAVRKLGA